MKKITLPPEDNPLSNLKPQPPESSEPNPNDLESRLIPKGVFQTSPTPKPPPPKPEGIFADLNGQAPTQEPQSEPEVPPTPQAPTPPPEGISEGESPTPPTLQGSERAVFKFAGVIVLVFLGFFLFRGVRSVERKNRAELEAFVKTNPTGGYIDNTVTTQSKEVLPNETNASTESPTLDQQIMEDSKASLKTEIGKYEKYTDDRGRTAIKVVLDNYGEYDIYIPYLKYKDLEPKGYMLVDIELVNDKPTFLYMSSKQENLLDMLNN